MLKTDFKIEDSLLVLIDVQERLLKAMGDVDFELSQMSKCIRAAKAIGIPIIVTEQYPKGLGHTDGSLQSCLEGEKAIEKESFSCLREESFLKEVKKHKAENLILIGMETHVCVMQTALDALDAGMGCCVLADSVTSRHDYDKKYGLKLLREAGVSLMTFESLFMILLRSSSHEKFKALSGILKEG